MLTTSIVSVALLLCIIKIVHTKKSLLKLKADQDLLASINRNINEGIFRVKKIRELVYVNEELASIFGYDSPEELLGKNTETLFCHSEDYTSIGETLLAGEAITNKEIQFRRKDGSLFWGYLNSIKVKCKDGNTYFDGAIRDITEQKEARDKFHYHSEMQRTLINVSSRLMILSKESVDSSFTQCLEDLGKLVGADRAYFFSYLSAETCRNTHEWCSEGISPMIDHSQDIRLDADLKSLLRCHFEGAPLYISNVSEMPEGTAKQIFLEQDIKSLMSVPMMDGDNCIGFVGFDSVRDYRQYSETEIAILKLFANMVMNVNRRIKNLERLNVLLEKSNEQNERLKEFSFIVSHNFRGPVACLMSIIELYRQEKTDENLFKMLEDPIQKLNDIMQSMARLLSFENEIMKLEKEPCNLHQTITKVIGLIEHSLNKNGVEIKLDISSELAIEGYPGYIENIFYQVIHNAMKFGVTDTHKEIEISCQRLNGSKTLIAIKDQGLGFDQDKYSSKLFKPGTRLHAHLADGQGIGLFLAKYQMDLIGGNISIESIEGLGTKVQLEFS